MRSKRNIKSEFTDPVHSLPIGEGDLKKESNSRICKNGDWNINVYKGQKPGYITANPYTYPIIKDYRKELKDHQTTSELLLWKYLRNNKSNSPQ
jgi:hypothetical protein